MPNPLPTQLSGARFLANRQSALLADEPRVGKTGAAIIAADLIFAQTILVVTTASGRAVWQAAFKDWQAVPRSVGLAPDIADVTICSWAGAVQPAIRASLLRRRFDLLILDESHYAKTFDAARTCAVYGDAVAADLALRTRADAVWCLSGTPLPNSPADLFPMLRALAPRRLAAAGDLPDVRSYDAFMARYVQTRPKRISRFRSIQVVTGGQNLDELAQRLDGFMLRRTQADVGIRGPRYELRPLLVSDKLRRSVEANVDHSAVLAAAEAGDTRSLEMHLGPLRRHTGLIKAQAAVEAVQDELENGLDKIVLMAWHTDAIELLSARLRAYGAVSLSGATSPKHRKDAAEAFQQDERCRVFVGQIQAAGEAIDLSAASTLWFVESSFVPKDMAQAALRITNHTQRRQAFVKVCTLAGSIDEALQAVLLRKWSCIREVLR